MVKSVEGGFRNRSYTKTIIPDFQSASELNSADSQPQQEVSLNGHFMQGE